MTNSERVSIPILDETSSDSALVRMGDGDHFFVAMADAARACKAIDDVKDFTRQFRELITSLDEWVKPRRAKIKCAYLTVRESDMLFLVVMRNVRFDRELTDELTDLDLDIANSEDLQLVNLEVLLIPPVSEDSCKAFLSSGTLCATYAK